MTTGLLLQYAIVAVLVLISALVMFRKLAPHVATRWQAGMAASLNQPRRAHWMQRLGRRLQPKVATGNCGDGCNTCNSCGPTPPRHARGDVQPLEFKPRRQ